MEDNRLFGIRRLCDDCGGISTRALELHWRAMTEMISTTEMELELHYPKWQEIKTNICHLCGHLV